MILWLWVACGGSDEPPAAPPLPDHVGEWDALLHAVARGDRSTAQVLARDLSLGPVDGAHEGAATMGSGLGFAQVADTHEELVLGVSRAASGCAACHLERKVVAPSAPLPGHAGALPVAGWAAVWGQTAPCPPPADAAVCAAWPALDGVLEACQGCHAK